MVVTGIDALITKFQALQAAASSAAAASAGAMTSSDSSLSISSSKPAPGSFQNTDSSLSAQEVAAKQSEYYSGNGSKGLTVNINQQLSRSDVNSIVSEQKRLAGRI